MMVLCPAKILSSLAYQALRTRKKNSPNSRKNLSSHQ